MNIQAHRAEYQDVKADPSMRLDGNDALGAARKEGAEHVRQ